MLSVSMAVAATVLASAAGAKEAPAGLADWAAFIDERQQWCQRYRATPDQKKRAALFAKYTGAIKKKRFAAAAVPATVTGVESTHNGSKVTLDVRTPYGECTNSDVWALDSLYHIDRGTRLYDQVLELAEGQAVLVSLANVKPWHNELLPEASMCNGRWLVRYTTVERAKK